MRKYSDQLPILGVAFCLLLIFGSTCLFANEVESYQDIIEREFDTPQFYESLETAISLNDLNIAYGDYVFSTRLEVYGNLANKYRHDIKKKKALSFLVGIEYLHSSSKSIALDTFFNITNAFSDVQTQSEAMFWIGLTHFRQSNYIDAERYLKECSSKSSQIGNYDKLIKSYYYLGLTSYKQNRKRAAIEFYKQSLKVSKERENARWVVPACRKIGVCYKQINEYDNALKYYEMGLDYGSLHDYEDQNDLILINIGNLYKEAGDFDKALANYEYSYNIRKKRNDLEPMTLCLKNLGAIYEILGEYEKAQEYFEEAYDIAKNSLYLKERTVYYKMDIGRVLMLNNKMEEANSVLQTCLLELREYNLVQLEISCLFYIGKNWMKNGQDEKALKYFQEAKAKMGDEGLAMKIQIDDGLAEVYMRQKKYNKAISICNSNLDKSFNDEANRINILPILSKLSGSYAAIGKYKEALEATSKIVTLEREIFNKSKMREIGKFEMKVSMNSHIEEREKSIKLLQIENENHKLLNSKRMQQFLIVAGLLIFSLVILGMLYFFLSKNKRKNLMLVNINEKLNGSIRIIEGQKEQLNSTIVELEESEAKLKENNIELNKVLELREKVIKRLQRFGSVLAHDFKEPVRTIVSFGKLLNGTIRDKCNEREKEFLDFVVNSTGRLSIMVDRLYAYSNNTLALMNKFQVINFETIIRNVQKDLKLRINSKQARVEMEPIYYSIQGDNVMIYQLFQNLISNALKYSRQGSKPVITIKNQIIDDTLVISISDNGVGIDCKGSTNIFDLFSRTLNTADRAGHGLGLAICKEVVDIHGGHIDYCSELGEGTTFNLHFKEFQEMPQILEMKKFYEQSAPAKAQLV